MFILRWFNITMDMCRWLTLCPWSCSTIFHGYVRVADGKSRYVCFDSTKFKYQYNSIIYHIMFFMASGKHGKLENHRTRWIQMGDFPPHQGCFCPCPTPPQLLDFDVAVEIPSWGRLTEAAWGWLKQWKNGCFTRRNEILGWNPHGTYITFGHRSIDHQEGRIQPRNGNLASKKKGISWNKGWASRPRGLQ